MEKMPRRITLIIAETDTSFIFELPSKVLDRDTPQGVEADAENARYDYLTLGKGRNRKMIDQSIQTLSSIVITRGVQKHDITVKDSHAFASVWDMYDTYNGITNDYLNYILVKNDEELYNLKHKQKRNFSVEEEEEENMLELLRKPKFLDAIEIIERLLANNNFNEQQKRFRGLSDPDPFRENIKFNYRLHLLWTFANDKTAGRAVSCFKWNPSNKDILAVGYGKFYFADDTNGIVMVWNIKNPMQPERSYTFKTPVTSLNFSKLNPHLLVVGFNTGHIKIIDITKRYLDVVARTTRDTSPCFEAIWQVDIETDEHTNSEQIFSVGRDGRICRTGPLGPNQMITTQIMRICKTEGKMKGLQTTKKFVDPGIRVGRYQSALISCKHPTEENIYFVGTGEGSIHKCSRYSFHREFDAFSAHDGPIYQMKFSPFCNKLLMTCGDDWNIRLWCEGIDEPVLSLRDNFHSIQGADWCPTHSTIIASICGKDIVLWDLQRKVYSSQSITRSPTNSRNTVIEFTEDGRCLAVGDVNGNVHIYSLEDMPFPPFFQADILIRALQRALVSKPNYLKRFLKNILLHHKQK